jgi:hypothetical protein
MNGPLFGGLSAAVIGPLARDAGSNMVVAQTAWAVGSLALIENMLVDRRGRFE